MKLVQQASHGKAVKKRLGAVLLVGVGVLIVGYFVVRETEGVWSLGGWSLLLLVFAWLAGRLNKLIDYHLGDRGESDLVKKLELLGDEYTVVTNWQPPGEKRGDVDILVLGPHGVAALECKKYTTDFGCDGDFWFLKMENGYKKRVKSLSRQTRGHVQSLKRHLKRQGVGGEVHAALCFSSLRRASISNPTVEVIDYDDAVDFIYSLPRTGGISLSVFE